MKDARPFCLHKTLRLYHKIQICFSVRMRRTNNVCSRSMYLEQQTLSGHFSFFDHSKPHPGLQSALKSQFATQASAPQKSGPVPHQPLLPCKLLAYNDFEYSHENLLQQPILHGLDALQSCCCDKLMKRNGSIQARSLRNSLEFIVILELLL